MLKNKWVIGVLVAVALIILIVAGRYIYKAIYPPIVAQNPQVEAIKQDVIKERIIIKEVIRNEQKKTTVFIDALPDDDVADEWQNRLRQYRFETSGDSSE